ncbi:hypothetical protein M3Y99_01333000 [Aphelenchoides fujianensis]|nr:hypothetical protein M3Y99_01333000 [Aphelenchoides fujianensis]
MRKFRSFVASLKKFYARRSLRLLLLWKSWELDQWTEIPELGDLSADIEGTNEKAEPLFTLVDREDDEYLYGIDYSHVHPFNNSCRFPTNPMPRRAAKSWSGIPAFSSLPAEYECYARPLSGALRPYRKRVRFTEQWVPLPKHKRIRFTRDQFAVKCLDSRYRMLFYDHFTDITTKSRLNSTLSVEGVDKYSLSILAIDSTSRNQFFRHMPATLRFMRDHEFQILHGYTKIADNSAVNLLPLFAGKSFDTRVHGMEGLVRPDMTLNDSAIFEDHWEHAKWLIKQVRDRGGVNMINDEIMHTGLGLLNYDKFMGYHTPPADYYFRPYYESLFQKTEIKSQCLNGQFVVDRWLRMWENFALKYAKKWNLSFNFITTMTHDYPNNLELFDDPLHRILKRLKKGGVFENTFLVIMGDHGQRMNDIQKTFTGRIEERMPFMSIYVPQMFRAAHPEAYRNLIANKNRLVSNFDLHETFRDVLRIHEQPHNPVGISLFRRLPAHRTCEDARIAEHHCMCLHEERMELSLHDQVDREQQRMVQLSTDKDPQRARRSASSQPTAFTFRTMNPMARTGARFPSMWIDHLNRGEKHESRWNEMFDVEFERDLTIRTRAIRPVGARLRTRVFFNQKTGHMRLTAEPWVRNVDGGRAVCEPLILARLCSCLS